MMSQPHLSRPHCDTTTVHRQNVTEFFKFEKSGQSEAWPQRDFYISNSNCDSEKIRILGDQLNEARQIEDNVCNRVHHFPHNEKFTPPEDPQNACWIFSDPHESIKKLLELLTNKHTENMKERIVAMLHCFLGCVGDSFSIHELSHVVEVLPLLLVKDDKTNNYYEDYITKLLLKARKTPVYKTSRCEIIDQNLQTILQRYLKGLVQSLMVTKNEKHRANIVHALHDLFLHPQENEKSVEVEHLWLCLEKCSSFNTVCDILESSGPSVYILLLRFMLIASGRSHSISFKIIERRCIDIILNRMLPDNPSNILMTRDGIVPLVIEYRKFVNLSLSVLDILLANYEKAILRLDIFISTKAISDLIKMIDCSNCPDDLLFTKEIRNQLLCIFVTLQKVFSQNGVQEAVNRLGLARKIIFMESILSITKRNGGFCSKNETKDKREKDFAKLLLESQYFIIQSVITLSDEEKLQLAQHCVPNLINDGEFLQCCFKWGRQFIPYLKEEFLIKKICKKLLNILKKFLKKSYENYVLIEALKTLDFTINMKDNGHILPYLIRQDSISILCGLCSEFLHDNTRSTEKTALIYILRCLIVLVENNTEAQNDYFEEFSNIFDRTLKIVHIQNSFNIASERQILMYVLVLVARAIIPNPASAAKFIKRAFIYKIMDLLALNDDSLTTIVLNILTDFCEDHRYAIPFLLTWREPNSGNVFLSKVCDLWRAYELLHGVRRDHYGVIADLEFPLMGTCQREQLENIAINSSPSLLETTFGIRTKLYAVVEMIREDVEAVTNHYNVGNNLNMEDQITMVLIENYLVLKQHELWQEIVQTFQTHGVNMHDASDELIQVLTEINRRSTRKVLEKQLAILNYHEILRIKSDENMYRAIRTAFHPNACGLYQN